MARIHGYHVASREAMLLMKYEHYGKCKGLFKDWQRKCKYLSMTLPGPSIKPSNRTLINLHASAKVWMESRGVKGIENTWINETTGEDKYKVHCLSFTSNCDCIYIYLHFLCDSLNEPLHLL